MASRAQYDIFQDDPLFAPASPPPIEGNGTSLGSRIYREARQAFGNRIVPLVTKARRIFQDDERVMALVRAARDSDKPADYIAGAIARHRKIERGRKRDDQSKRHPDAIDGRAF